MLSENEKRIKDLCQELGECLYKQSQIKKFNNLGEIEETVRDLMIQYVNPEREHLSYAMSINTEEKPAISKIWFCK